MRHAPIAPALFCDHRQRLVAALPPNSLAIVHAADTPPTNGDGVSRLIPAADLFWLTGIEQVESVLVLAPDAVDPASPRSSSLTRPSSVTMMLPGLTSR